MTAANMNEITGVRLPIDDLEDLIAAISARPVMYAGEYRFVSAMAYLNGCANTSEQLRDTGEWKTLVNFGLWMANKFDRPRNWAWHSILHDHFAQDDENAFKNLPILFREYREQNPNGYISPQKP